jgi:hypothetical protein
MGMTVASLHQSAGNTVFFTPPYVCKAHAFIPKMISKNAFMMFSRNDSTIAFSLLHAEESRLLA